MQINQTLVLGKEGLELEHLEIGQYHLTRLSYSGKNGLKCVAYMSRSGQAALLGPASRCPFAAGSDLRPFVGVSPGPRACPWRFRDDSSRGSSSGSRCVASPSASDTPGDSHTKLTWPGVPGDYPRAPAASASVPGWALTRRGMECRCPSRMVLSPELLSLDASDSAPEHRSYEDSYYRQRPFIGPWSRLPRKKARRIGSTREEYDPGIN